MEAPFTWLPGVTHCCAVDRAVSCIVSMMGFQTWIDLSGPHPLVRIIPAVSSCPDQRLATTSIRALGRRVLGGVNRLPGRVPFITSSAGRAQDIQVTVREGGG